MSPFAELNNSLLSHGETLKKTKRDTLTPRLSGPRKNLRMLEVGSSLSLVSTNSSGKWVKTKKLATMEEISLPLQLLAMV
jgi:hypothetical protein